MTTIRKEAIPLDAVLHREMADPRFAAKVKTKAKLLELGAAIRRARDGVQMTQKELAEFAGLAQPDVSAIENGTGLQGPTVSTLVRIARALGCDLDIRLSIAVEAEGLAEPARETAFALIEPEELCVGDDQILEGTRAR